MCNLCARGAGKESQEGMAELLAAWEAVEQSRAEQVGPKQGSDRGCT